MLGFTYTELTQALQSWPRKRIEEYLDDLDRIIQMGELRLIKDLNIELFDVRDSTPVVTANSRYVSKPVGLLSTRALFLLTAGTRTPLLQRSLDYCLNYAPLETATGTPTYFAEYDESRWYLVATPSISTTVEVHGVKRPESIVTADSTWLGDQCGDLLFHAALMAAEHWLKADDRFADIEAEYNKRLGVWKLENRTLIRQGDYSPTQPAAETTKGQQRQ